MYKVNVMQWGDLSPKFDRFNICKDRLHIWKCNVNKYGIVTSCKLIRENCRDMSDTKGLRQVFYNLHDVRDHVKLCEQLKKEVQS